MWSLNLFFPHTAIFAYCQRPWRVGSTHVGWEGPSQFPLYSWLSTVFKLPTDWLTLQEDTWLHRQNSILHTHVICWLQGMTKMLMINLLAVRWTQEQRSWRPKERRSTKYNKFITGASQWLFSAFSVSLSHLGWNQPMVSAFCLLWTTECRIWER